MSLRGNDQRKKKERRISGIHQIQCENRRIEQTDRNIDIIFKERIRCRIKQINQQWQNMF